MADAEFVAGFALAVSTARTGLASNDIVSAINHLDGLLVKYFITVYFVLRTDKCHGVFTPIWVLAVQ